MRDWRLRPGDPLTLTLAADHRLCAPDLRNDHAWEMEIGGGDPPAMAVRTTYGLRARSMRIFSRFVVKGKVFCNPEEFFETPSLRFFAPNYMAMDYEPVPGLHVQAETWVPDPHTLAGRMTISNRTNEPLLLQVELCGQLSPMQGEGLRNVLLHSAQILSGRTVDLTPVIFLTGGPTPAESSLPGLVLRLALAAGDERNLTWVQAALGSQEESFEHARQTAARPWEAEIARLELVNQASTVDIHCGDPDWDAAFALSQKQALSLFIQGLDGQTETSFLASRQPDQACSALGQVSAGLRAQNPSDLECYYLGNVLAGCPEMAVGLVRRQLGSVGDEGQSIQNQNGMPNTTLPLPLLAGMAWEACQRLPGRNFQAELFPVLEKTLECWLDRTHDRDGDGLPECDFNPVESLDELSTVDGKWKLLACPDGLFVENPALGAMLYHDFQALAGMAGGLGLEERKIELQQKAEHLREVVEECWDSHAGIYHRRDWLSHQSPLGSDLVNLKGSGRLDVGKSLRYPTRLVIVMSQQKEAGRGISITLAGGNNEGGINETFSREDFHWSHDTWYAVSRHLYTSIEFMQAEGVEKKNHVGLKVMDFSRKDITQFLPLWAGVPTLDRVDKMLTSNLKEGKRFWGAFGIPYEPGNANKAAVSQDGMFLPLNAMLAEGLASYGRQAQAVCLLGGMMGAVVSNLRQHKAFLQYYDAKTGIGRGERNVVQGLAPLGTFLKLLGVEFCPPGRVIIVGKNPFPWQVTVKYRDITVTRWMDSTDVTFRGGQSITLSDPTDAVVEAE